MTAKRLLRRAVLWIAWNDEPGSPHALNPDYVSSLISTMLIADTFEVHADKVAEMVVAARRKEEEEKEKNEKQR